MRDKRSAGLYFLSFLMVLGLKLYSDRAGSDELLWILKPTAWWTGALSGFSFTYEQGAGYVNHSLRFIIAPACAGLRFWMIACLMLSWSFIHRMDSGKKQLYWTLLCLPASCMVTVFVNGIRIALSIVLPRLLQNTGGGIRFFTPGQLHTAIGTLVYFLSLLALYQAGDRLSGKIGAAGKKENKRSLRNRLLPVFWYMGPVLGLPFLSRMAWGDFENFADYEAPVLLVCGGVIFGLSLFHLGKRLFAVFLIKRHC